MKMAFVAVAIFIIVSILLLSFQWYLRTTINDMISKLEEIDSHIKNEEFDKAYKIYKTMRNLWEKHEKIYSLQIEHSELDNVYIIFSRLDACFNDNKFKSYTKLKNELNYLLNHFILKNKVNIETIF